MSLNFLRNIVFIIVLLLAQTLLLNHISVFGCATPLLYVYFALTVQRGEAKWATLLWCFFMGLLVDIFTNTPGVAAASMTLVGFLQPYVVELFAMDCLHRGKHHHHRCIDFGDRVFQK